VEKNDTAAIEQSSNAIGNLMAQMTAAHAKADAAFYQTLNPDQQNKMKEMESHHRGMGMHGHHGPGGAGGPGGPGGFGPGPGAFFQ
jgi:Spy/CpxP family protein refolding chaperone